LVGALEAYPFYGITSLSMAQPGELFMAVEEPSLKHVIPLRTLGQSVVSKPVTYQSMFDFVIVSSGWATVYTDGALSLSVPVLFQCTLCLLISFNAVMPLVVGQICLDWAV
jgi:hypothetical protein